MSSTYPKSGIVGTTLSERAARFWLQRLLSELLQFRRREVNSCVTTVQTNPKVLNQINRGLIHILYLAKSDSQFPLEALQVTG